ncbi:MAG: hypothetical protein IKI72_03720 [Bacteroidales bacterium]|nr:hypothetical protein [Bacteroidales bacterium]
MIWILCLAAGLCLVGITGTAAEQILSDAPGVSTTMDSLETHVWVRYVDTTTYFFYLYQNDTIYNRAFYQNNWQTLRRYPFYFFTPDKENVIDALKSYTTLPIFMSERLGQRRNGRHYAYRYNIERQVFNDRVATKSMEIILLTADSLQLLPTDYYMERSPREPTPTVAAYVATSLPFPFENQLSRLSPRIVQDAVRQHPTPRSLDSVKTQHRVSEKGWDRPYRKESSGTAPRIPTTMDSLESHTWVMEDTWEYYGHILTYKMFRNDTIYTRICTDDIWGQTFAEPFYFFSPEFPVDGIKDRNDGVFVLPMFIPERIGESDNGRHLVYRFNIFGQPSWQILQALSNVRSLEIVSLSDKKLILKETEYYSPLPTPPLEYVYTACDLPFPWDENLYLYGSARPYRQQIREAKRKVREQYGRNKKL